MSEPFFSAATSTFSDNTCSLYAYRPCQPSLASILRKVVTLTTWAEYTIITNYTFWFVHTCQSPSQLLIWTQLSICCIHSHICLALHLYKHDLHICCIHVHPYAHNILPWSVATIFSDPPLRRNRASLSRVADTLPFGKNLSDSVREF